MGTQTTCSCFLVVGQMRETSVIENCGGIPPKYVDDVLIRVERISYWRSALHWPLAFFGEILLAAA